MVLNGKMHHPSKHIIKSTYRSEVDYFRSGPLKAASSSALRRSSKVNTPRPSTPSNPTNSSSSKSNLFSSQSIFYFL
jgi:hypothetical protein